MSLPVVLTPEAQTEFDEAADWYEHQVGLGAAFTGAMREALNRISATPLLHQVVYQDIRRAIVSGSRIVFSTELMQLESR